MNFESTCKTPWVSCQDWMKVMIEIMDEYYQLIYSKVLLITNLQNHRNQHLSYWIRKRIFKFDSISANFAVINHSQSKLLLYKLTTKLKVHGKFAKLKDSWSTVWSVWCLENAYSFSVYALINLCIYLINRHLSSESDLEKVSIFLSDLEWVKNEKKMP